MPAFRHTRPTSPARPGHHGLALAGTLVLLALLGIAAAMAQRAAALQWRAARIQAEELQLHEDAMTAQAAALQWLRAGGWREPARDGSTLPPGSRRPSLFADAVEPLQAQWPPTWSHGVDGCVHACGFRVQRLAQQPGRPPTMRILAYASGPSLRVLEHDVSQDPPRDTGDAPAGPRDGSEGEPCWRDAQWWVPR